MNENLLIDSRIDAVRQRLVYTLENIKFQKNVAFWDDIEKIEHCIKALENIEPQKKTYVRMCLRRKENIRRAPRIKLSTIHGSKGGEAEQKTYVKHCDKPETENKKKKEENQFGASSTNPNAFLILDDCLYDAAWAKDNTNKPIFTVIPGGEKQREFSYRFGVNLVMYAMTGNYKADQVHIKSILKRLNNKDRTTYFFF